MREDEGMKEDEDTKEDKEMWMDDERVELQVCGEGEESSDVEEKDDEEHERDGDEEEEDGDEEGVDDEGGAEPEVSMTPWWPRVPCPRMKAWKGKPVHESTHGSPGSGPARSVFPWITRCG